jgi:hypothetical protein
MKQLGLIALCAAGIALGPSSSLAQAAAIPVQLGVRITPDTVTVGQRFIAVIRVRVPRGAEIVFPRPDSASTDSVTATQMIGQPAIDSIADSTATVMSAAYRLAAWDVGPQPLGIGNILVRFGGDSGYVSLASRTVFVRSVLPEDSALRVPKPPRAAIALAPFNWIPYAIAAASLALALLLWRIWVWYRRRRSAPVDPFTAAEREFDRIEALRLIESAEPQRHAALMSDAMRDYLAARVPAIERSQTSSELLANAGEIRVSAQGLGDLLWRADLIKFANAPVTGDEAAGLGKSARAIVRDVEQMYRAREKERVDKAA